MQINEKLPILFFGLGGAGQRQLRIMRGLFPGNQFYAFRFKNKTPLLNSDFSVNIKSSLEEQYQIKILDNFSETSKIKPFLTVISLPTSMHAEYSLYAHSIGSNVLVEKPGFFKNEEIISLKNKFLNSKLKFMVGFQRQFNPVLNLLKNILNSGELGELKKGLIKVSSFVPNWHSYENYQDLYACKSTLGGGVLHTECHEIFLICTLFGSPEYCKKKYTTSPSHNIDVGDTCNLEIVFKKFNIFCDISFFREPNERNITFIMSLGTIILDLNSNKITIIKKGKEIKEKKFNFSNDYLFDLQARSVIDLDYENSKTFKNLEDLGKIIN